MKNHFPVVLSAILSLPFAAIPGGAFAQNPGSLDLSFDPGAGAYDVVLTTAIQSDGKILIGGWFTSYNGTPRNHIARLNVDGSLDATFNPGTGANEQIQTIAIQNDGKILIGGYFTSYNGTPRNHIARLNPGGSLDFTFDPGAGVTGFESGVWTTAIQSDGKIIIGGIFTGYNGTPRNYIARLNAGGSLDTSFDPGEGAEYHVYATSIQSDGRILIGGIFTSYNGIPMSSVARLNTDGSLDATFDPGTGTTSVYATAIQSDGRPVIAGMFDTYNGTPRNSIARLNPDGSLDATFDPGAGVGGGIYPRLFTIASQSDDKIIIGGDFTSYNGMPRNRIACLNTDGSLDMTFDPSAGANDWVYTIAIKNDGRVVIGGYFWSYNGTPRNHIARLHCEGTVGIDGATSQGFSMSPNPASSSTTIVMPEQGRTQLVVRNAIGQEVLRGTVVAGRNDIALNGLVPGLYAVQVGTSAAQRLVVE